LDNRRSLQGEHVCVNPFHIFTGCVRKLFEKLEVTTHTLGILAVEARRTGLPEARQASIFELHGDHADHVLGFPRDREGVTKMDLFDGCL
jgi:hypothetical protein